MKSRRKQPITGANGWRVPAERDRLLSKVVSFGIILTIVFMVELLVMQLLPFISGGQSPLVVSLIDATVLTVISSPFLWLFVARPLESAVLSEQSWGSSLLGSVRDGVIVFDREGRIVLANATAGELFGASAEELSGLQVTDLVTLADDGVPGAAFLLQADAIRPVCQETMGRRRNGESFPLEISLSHAEREHHLVVVGILRDITLRKQLEDEVARARDDWEEVFTSITDAITIIDDHHTIVRANPAAEQLLGEAMVTLLHSKCFRLFHGFDHAPTHCQSCEVLKSQIPSSLEFFEPHLHKYLEVKALPRCDRDGRPAGLIHVMRDITERKQAEQELQQKNAELERFVYTVSHDLKTPVVTFKAFLGMFEQNLAAGEADLVREDLHYLHDAADRMGQLLGDLLELSRIGRITSPLVRVSSHEVVDDALTFTAGTIVKRQVAVRVGDEFVILYGDRVRLVEIWQNLIDNAVKYMGDQPAPQIEIGLRQDEGEPVFFVRDNGMGIDPRFHDKVFDLFEQLDPHTEGTGLGLALVKRIVELNDGKIWVESAGAGAGSCFCFTLPKALGDKAAKEPAPPPGLERMPPS